MESRDLTWIGLAMVLVVVLGFLVLGIVLKFHGWPDQTTIRFYPLTIWLRVYGAWLMLLPLAWAVYAAFAMQVDRGLLSATFAAAVGGLIVGFLFLAFLSAVGFPGTRPLLIYVAPAGASAPR